MAQSLYQFDIDDDSPEIAYFPFVNTLPGSGVGAGWQLQYTTSGAATTLGEVGVGTSYYRTYASGASLLVNWNGTGIELIGSVSNASYNVTLDGVLSSQNSTDGTLVSLNGLQNTNHSLLLTTNIMDTASPDAFLTFDKARIVYGPPAGLVDTTASSQAISDSNIAYMGSWSYITDNTGNSMHVSTFAGDCAQTTFHGSAITIYGLTSSYSGNFSVTLDNITTNLSAISSYNNSKSLLFYATGLPQDVVHHIAVINQENSTFALQVGGMNTTCFGNCTTNDTNSSSSHSIAAGTIAAIVLGVVLLLVIAGVSWFLCCVRRRRRARAASQHAILGMRRQQFNDKSDIDVEQVPNSSVPSGEMESTTLSTSKGYGFGLGLRRGFTFMSRKSKAAGSDSSGTSPNGLATEFHPMTPRFHRDEKLFSINTLTENFVVLAPPPESEKLAPGWCNPVARTPRSFKEAHGFTVPELRIDYVGSVEDEYDDDVDVKTLTSRQDEALAATLCLSPRTSEGFSAFDGVTALPKVDADTGEYIRQTPEQQPEFLQVRGTSPFRVDMAALFGARVSSHDSRRNSGSGGSTWSKVRTRLYRRAHLDDGKQSYHTDKQETASSSGPESVPVVMHDSDSAKQPSETPPSSGKYSFLDLTSSHTSLQKRHSTANTLSSTPAELGHGGKDISTWSENTSVRMIRVEHPRDDNLSPKPDAPSTASGGSSPSDDEGAQTAFSALTTQTQRSPPLSFSITLPSSTHTIAPSEHVSDVSETTPSPPDTPSPDPDTAQYLHVPPPTPLGVSVTSASSPTESIPFSISEIHFRHSFSDYTGLDSRRASTTSYLPPHPPLPRIDGSQPSTPSYSPPPYVVQRVLGLAVSPLTPASFTRIPLSSSTITVTNASRPETAPTQRARGGSLLGPRPRPSTAGSVRGSAAPQLPMQGGRGSLRGPRNDR